MDLDGQLGGGTPEAHVHTASVRVSAGVGDGLDHDPQRTQVNRGGQATAEFDRLHAVAKHERHA